MLRCYILIDRYILFELVLFFIYFYIVWIISIYYVKIKVQLKFPLILLWKNFHLLVHYICHHTITREVFWAFSKFTDSYGPILRKGYGIFKLCTCKKNGVRHPCVPPKLNYMCRRVCTLIKMKFIFNDEKNVMLWNEYKKNNLAGKRQRNKGRKCWCFFMFFLLRYFERLSFTWYFMNCFILQLCFIIFFILQRLFLCLSYIHTFI